MCMLKDSLDFKNMQVGKLFARQLIPNMLGMVASSMFAIVDGIFVGRGVGSDALAAVNIALPLLMIMTGIGLMFGTGGSVLASINLSRGKERLANINITQSFAVSFLFSTLLTLAVVFFPYHTARLLGAGEALLEPAVEYLFWFSITLPFTVLCVSLPFFVRLTNPKIAMYAMLVSTLVNIVLDYLFIFPFGWGLMGAAIATDIGEMTGCAILLAYLFRKSVAVRFTKFKASLKSIRLTLRNVWYMVRLGFPSFLSEAAIATMAITGNYIFMKYLGADGVAAFSIVCYLFPIVFMAFNATVQSAQPIISFNYGCGQMNRAREALRRALLATTGIGLFVSLCFMFFSGGIVSLFIPDAANAACGHAIGGLPLFAADYVFFGINIIAIGYYTGVERVKRAVLLTLSRTVLPVIFFFTLPSWLGVAGIWLSVAAGDFTTTIIVVFLLLKDKTRANGRPDKPDKQSLQTE